MAIVGLRTVANKKSCIKSSSLYHVAATRGRWIMSPPGTLRRFAATRWHVGYWATPDIGQP